MKKTYSLLFASIFTASLITACSNEPSVSFTSNVKPIVDKHCAECHMTGGEGANASGFIVESYETLMKGTKYGPVIVAGDPLSSSLYRLISGKVDKSIEMPHSKEPLSSGEIAMVENWINQGAVK